MERTPVDEFVAELVRLDSLLGGDNGCAALHPGLVTRRDVERWKLGEKFPDEEQLLSYGWQAEPKASIAQIGLLIHLWKRATEHRRLHLPPDDQLLEEAPEPRIGPRVPDSRKLIGQHDYERAAREYEGKVPAEAGVGVFISYRRADEPHLAGRLYDRLRVDLAHSRIFLDTVVPPGQNFVEALGSALDRCAVMLVIIGGRWRVPRPDEADDFVRVEIETALARGITVLPILVDNMTMPSAGTLPCGMSGLARCMALRVFHDSFDAGYEVLLSRLRAVAGRSS